MNSIDVTDMTDEALDVLLRIKGGEDCVTVEHLSYDERVSVCKALGVEARQHWLMSAPYAAPCVDHSTHPMFVHNDIEAMILDRQDTEI